jgi:RimJ/RimL family protein N-acetyltransferase
MQADTVPAGSPVGMRADTTPADAPALNLVGEKVALGPLRRDLIPLYHRWNNDFAVSLTVEEMAPETLDNTEAWYLRAGKGDVNDRVSFTVYERPALRPVGTANLHRIDHVHRTAFFGMAISEKECWGKGYGTETAQLVLAYGFAALNLHSVRLTVYEFNARGIRAYTRAGFKPIGRWRQAVCVGDRHYDVIYMDILATEFQSPHLARLLPTP